jgi:hypothetical protein
MFEQLTEQVDDRNDQECVAEVPCHNNIDSKVEEKRDGKEATEEAQDVGNPRRLDVFGLGDGLDVVYLSDFYKRCGTIAGDGLYAVGLISSGVGKDVGINISLHDDEST